MIHTRRNTGFDKNFAVKMKAVSFRITELEFFPGW